MIGALAGFPLIAGLWTPAAGVVTACAEAWVALASPAHAGRPAALAVLGMTLVLVGPESGPSMPGFTAVSTLPGFSNVAPDARFARGASTCPFVASASAFDDARAELIGTCHRAPSATN